MDTKHFRMPTLAAMLVDMAISQAMSDDEPEPEDVMEILVASHSLAGFSELWACIMTIAQNDDFVANFAIMSVLTGWIADAKATIASI